MKLAFALVASTLAAAAGPVEAPASKLHDQIRGGLLGHILGDLNGLKHEMKYLAEPGNVERYTPALPEGAWTDDDTDVEWVYLVEMQRARTVLLPAPRIAELWRRHINRRIWCSHLYLRQLLDIGIEPPLTGSPHLNPWADFNLSAQFVSESWGLIAPGMPRTAARIGTHYTHVSIDGEPIQATQLFTAMIATAFLTGDIDRIVEAGIAATDPRSEMRKLALDVHGWHRRNPRDWRATRRLLKEKYAISPSADDIRDRNGVKLNGGSTIAALLYGHGDFVETVRHAFNFGWDADNNAATAGTVVGVLKGAKWIMGQGWQIQDRFRNTSRDQMPEDETITGFGDRLIAMAEQVIAGQGGTKTESVYRINTETAANVEPLADFRAQFASLQSKLRAEVEQDVAAGDSARQARAAYLAICLDLAPALRQKYPRRWDAALQALTGFPRLIEVMFKAPRIPLADRIRENAVAAGLRPVK